MRVLRDLRQRRVAPNLAGDAVKQAFESTDEIQQIEAYLERKYRNGISVSCYRTIENCSPCSGNCATPVSARAHPFGCLKRYAANAERLEDEPETEE